MLNKHLDEAREAAVRVVSEWVRSKIAIDRACLVDDLFGKLRLAYWSASLSPEAARADLAEKLSAGCGPWWTGDIREASKGSDALLLSGTWEDAIPCDGNEKVRLLHRHRNRRWWFSEQEPVWELASDAEPSVPPVVVFYSFKGGVGRSTALASFAMRRAKLGERVVVIDLDLDAPGVAQLLAVDERGTMARWGVLDYMLESGATDFPLSDYYHTCRRAELVGDGEVVVFPAGFVDREYLQKLARLDVEGAVGEELGGLAKLLRKIRDELKPKWVLIDSRAGLSDIGGLLLSGVANFHVLLGTTSEQSWRGLSRVVQRLGGDRVRKGRMQADVLLAGTMFPADSVGSKAASESFANRARAEFRDNYFAADPADAAEDAFWYVRDMESADAPHVPVSIPYEPRLAFYADLKDIANQLVDSAGYRELARRIEERFASGGE